LQHVLYRAAKAGPGRRFHALMDRVLRRGVLWRAWVMVRSNNGAPGIDKTTLADVEEYGIGRLLDELAGELREKRYRPLPARRVLIPKPGTAEMRPLSIPAVRDRIVQAAEDRARAGLRGGLPAVQLRVPPQAVGARCPASAR
jgi:RNA-directed DNA polymerase